MGVEAQGGVVAGGRGWVGRVRLVEFFIDVCDPVGDPFPACWCVPGSCGAPAGGWGS